MAETTKAHDPITPGEILLTEFLEPLGITQYRLAQATGLSGHRRPRAPTGRAEKPSRRREMSDPSAILDRCADSPGGRRRPCPR